MRAHRFIPEYRMPYIATRFPLSVGGFTEGRNGALSVGSILKFFDASTEARKVVARLPVLFGRTPVVCGMSLPSIFVKRSVTCR